MRALLVATLALAGCGDLFTADAPQGYACSSSNSCPPGQQCVPSEHVCRTPCTQTTMSGMTGPGNNGQCSNINSGSDSGMAMSCDYDHFCRRSCSGNSGNICMGSACTATEVCDAAVNICRPSCGSGCPSAWGCVDGSGGNVSMPAMCAVCRPLATSTFHAAMFADVAFYDSGAGTNTRTVAVGDLGTGHASVVGVDAAAQKIFVFVNDGSGALLSPVAYAATPMPLDAAIVDINRDGKNDVVVATAQAPAGGPVFLPGNGDGTLGAQVTGPMIPSTKLALGDFDGDGKPDVAVAGGGTNTLSVVTANGSGGFKTMTQFSVNNGSFNYLGVADLNGDGKLDVWANDEHSFVYSFFGNGMGGFSQGPGSSFGNPLDAATLDIDGDGKIDLAVLTTMPDASGFGYFVGVGHNNGSGGFNGNGMQVSVPSGQRLVAADFDLDGKTDIALLEKVPAGKITSAIDILSGDGTRLVWSVTIPISKGAPDGINVGDLDGDGKPDLVLALGTGGVAVLLNTTPTSP